MHMLQTILKRNNLFGILSDGNIVSDVSLSCTVRPQTSLTIFIH